MKRKTRRRLLGCGLMTAMLLFAACSSGIQLTGVERGRMLVDSRYDTVSDSSGMRFLAPYKAKVDSLMSPVVGHAAHYMEASRPESDLSNLLADILMWGSRAFGEKPDFAVYNMGGIRAALSEGAVTIGNVLDVAPFENKICFLTLDGDKVEELFEQIAASGGEAISHGVRLVITKDGVDMSQLKKNNLDVSDLIESMRAAGYFNLDDVYYGLYEANGSFSALPREKMCGSLPVLIIDDGRPDRENMRIAGISEERLNNFLSGENTKLKQVAVMTVDGNGRVYFQPKGKRYSIRSIETEGKW